MLSPKSHSKPALIEVEKYPCSLILKQIFLCTSEGTYYLWLVGKTICLDFLPLVGSGSVTTRPPVCSRRKTYLAGLLPSSLACEISHTHTHTRGHPRAGVGGWHRLPPSTSPRLAKALQLATAGAQRKCSQQDPGSSLQADFTGNTRVSTFLYS